MNELPLVQISNVSKVFTGGKSPALDSISVDIKPGCITGLAGPDGSGKTTLMRLIAGLMIPSSGTLTVCGFDVVNNPEEIHEIAGYMPQRFGLYEDLTVIENLNLYADLQGVSQDERSGVFNRLLDFTDLKRFQKRLAGALSGGMKQKLGLMCALIRRPKLLLLDEPSVGVDPVSRRELWKIVRELAGQETGVVWSTAYLDEAERCDEIILLSEGKILYSGIPKKLTASMKGRSFLVKESASGRRSILDSAMKNDSVRDGVIQGGSVRLVLKSGADSSLIESLIPGRKLAAVPAEPRFEDAFVDLLQHRHAHKESGVASMIRPVHADSRTAVQAEGLTKCFGDFKAADDISFSIPPGRIFGLLGPNGAGKSTTFKMMCGLLKPTAGRAAVNGIDLENAPGRARSCIGYMAQKFSLYSNLSVAQNMDFFAGVYGLYGSGKRKTIGQLVDMFDLAQYIDSTAGELPLGFKQRLALSCSIMHNPVVLFLDEPTSGVDPLTRREFWNHMNAMVEKGVTVVVTTHFMEEAEYCDEIGLIHQGRMIASGSPDMLKDKVRSVEIPEPTLEDAFVELIKKTGPGNSGIPARE
ncbi:MAG TPA: multidrug ABC transporter ATP-binding protein [Lentisphaeria bacterium]|nr:MAG: multidrug ABC transporter ATP-binding protein [Lentisphaerae bacterium GWF2_49_21]HBC85889.1 multidrug ABC transporter ATP-binding protein [Lentisphaeria bacterium]